MGELLGFLGDVTNVVDSALQAHDYHEEMAFQARSMNDAIYNAAEMQRSEIAYQSNLSRMQALDYTRMYNTPNSANPNSVHKNTGGAPWREVREVYKTCTYEGNKWLRVAAVAGLGVLLVMPAIVVVLVGVLKY